MPCLLEWFVGEFCKSCFGGAGDFWVARLFVCVRVCFVFVRSGAAMFAEHSYCVVFWTPCVKKMHVVRNCVTGVLWLLHCTCKSDWRSIDGCVISLMLSLRVGNTSTSTDRDVSCVSLFCLVFFKLFYFSFTVFFSFLDMFRTRAFGRFLSTTGMQRDAFPVFRMVIQWVARLFVPVFCLLSVCCQLLTIIQKSKKWWLALVVDDDVSLALGKNGHYWWKEWWWTSMVREKVPAVFWLVQFFEKSRLISRKTMVDIWRYSWLKIPVAP